MKLLFIFFCSISSIFITQWKYVPDQASVKFAVYNDKNDIEADGVLTGLKGNVTINDTTGKPTSIIATIDTKTINSGIDLRDESLKSADFFEVQKYPTINFTSNKIESANDSLIATGILQIKNVSKEIAISFITQKISATETCLIGSFAIDRMQYTVGTKGDGIGNKVTIDLKIPITNK